MSILEQANVQIFGEGHPLICLHGGMGAEQLYLHVPGILDLVEKGFQVITYDHRGNGNFEESDHSLFNLEQWTQDLAAIVKELGLEEYSVLGHSYGGFIAQLHAIQKPEKLRSIILVDTSPYSETFLNNIEKATKPKVSEEEFRANMREGWDVFVSGDSVSMGIFDDMNLSQDAYIAGVRQLVGYDIRNQISGIDIPALVIVGRDDQRYVVRSELMASSIPGGELVIIENAHHMPFIDQPNEFAGLVAQWLTTHTL